MYWFTIWFSGVIGAILDRIYVSGRITPEELALIVALLCAITVNEKTAVLEDLLRKRVRVAIAVLTVLVVISGVAYLMVVSYS